MESLEGPEKTKLVILEKTELERFRESLIRLLSVLSSKKRNLDLSDEDLQKIFFPKNSRLFGLLNEKGVLIAVAQLVRKETDNNWWIENVVVDGKYQGKGLGKRILTELLKYAQENNIKELYLTSSRPVAQQLYLKLGFRRLKEIRKNSGKKTVLFKIDLSCA